ncbi:MAG: DNA-binding protein [Oscillospiraceae bacterium]|nr:DNA-binding protein [Oscillospiraceae bacterium]
MERDMLTYALLFDVYGDTLTEKQKLCCDLRYNQDLSLGEIGELEGISRQAVRDNLIRAEAQMRDLEEKIGAVRRSLQISSALAALESAADLARQQDLPEIRNYIDCAIGRLKE